MYLLHTVVSTYESQDIIKLVCDIDPGAVGGHVDKPLPTAVPDPDKPARLLSKQARRHDQSCLQ